MTIIIRKPARVLVCGGRDFADKGLLDFWLQTWLRVFGPEGMVIITGGARGADELANQWAAEHNVFCEVYPADWLVHGKSAGPLRNTEMLLDHTPDFVVAFPGGRGTADLVSRAARLKIPVVEVRP